MTHRRDDLGGDDGPSRGLGLRHALGQAVADRLHRGLRRQALLQVLFGCPAGLGVDNTIGGLVQHELARHPHELVAGLHGCGGVGETLQVAHQGTGIGGFEEPPAQLLRVGGGQFVPVLGAVLDHGRGPQPAVEMVMEGNLGQGA